MDISNQWNSYIDRNKQNISTENMQKDLQTY